MHGADCAGLPPKLPLSTNARIHPANHQSAANQATFAANADAPARIMAQTFARPLVGSALAAAHAARVRYLHDRVRKAHAPLEYRSARRSVQRAFYATPADYRFNRLRWVCLGFYCFACFMSWFKVVRHSGRFERDLKAVKRKPVQPM